MTTDEPSATSPIRQGRDSQGRYVEKEGRAEQAAEALRLRTRGNSYRAIGATMGVHHDTAHQMVKDALASIYREPAEDLVQMSLMKLDALERACLAVLEAHHVVVNQGEIIRADGETALTDSAPVLAAARELRMIDESRRKLLGLDSPSKIESTVPLELRIVGSDDV